MNILESYLLMREKKKYAIEKAATDKAFAEFVREFEPTFLRMFDEASKEYEKKTGLNNQSSFIIRELRKIFEINLKSYIKSKL